MFVPNSKKPQLSLVLLTYTLTDFLREMTNSSAYSYVDQYDELVVTEDGGAINYGLLNFCETYILGRNAGFSANANRGWKLAQGDYVAIVSNDTKLVSGNLRDLCIPGVVTSPLINNQSLTSPIAGSFFVVPRPVFEKVGMLDESLHTYYSDTEYIERLERAGIPMQIVPSVVISHLQAVTVTAAGQNTPEQSYQDKSVYEQNKRSDSHN